MTMFLSDSMLTAMPDWSATAGCGRCTHCQSCPFHRCATSRDELPSTRPASTRQTDPPAVAASVTQVAVRPQVQAEPFQCARYWPLEYQTSVADATAAVPTPAAAAGSWIARQAWPFQRSASY